MSRNERRRKVHSHPPQNTLPSIHLLVIGEEGAGKTTLINNFCGYSKKPKASNNLNDIFVKEVKLIQRQSKFSPLRKTTEEGAFHSSLKRRRFLQLKERDKSLRFIVELCEMPMHYLLNTKEFIRENCSDELYSMITRPHAILFLVDSSLPKPLFTVEKWKKEIKEMWGEVDGNEILFLLVPTKSDLKRIRFFEFAKYAFFANHNHFSFCSPLSSLNRKRVNKEIYSFIDKILLDELNRVKKKMNCRVNWKFNQPVIFMVDNLYDSIDLLLDDSDDHIPTSPFIIDDNKQRKKDEKKNKEKEKDMKEMEGGWGMERMSGSSSGYSSYASPPLFSPIIQSPLFINQKHPQNHHQSQLQNQSQDQKMISQNEINKEISGEEMIDYFDPNIIDPHIRSSTRLLKQITRVYGKIEEELKWLEENTKTKKRKKDIKILEKQRYHEFIDLYNSIDPYKTSSEDGEISSEVTPGYDFPLSSLSSSLSSFSSSSYLPFDQIVKAFMEYQRKWKSLIESLKAEIKINHSSPLHHLLDPPLPSDDLSLNHSYDTPHYYLYPYSNTSLSIRSSSSYPSSPPLSPLPLQKEQKLDGDRDLPNPNLDHKPTSPIPILSSSYKANHNNHNEGNKDNNMKREVEEEVEEEIITSPRSFTPRSGFSFRNARKKFEIDRHSLDHIDFPSLLSPPTTPLHS